MRFGLAPTQSLPRFDAMRTQARMAEDLGFEMLWAHEHHSEAMMYPDPLAALAAMAPVTERIGLGTNMLLLPIRFYECQQRFRLTLRPGAHFKSIH